MLFGFSYGLERERSKQPPSLVPAVRRVPAGLGSSCGPTLRLKGPGWAPLFLNLGALREHRHSLLIAICAPRPQPVTRSRRSSSLAAREQRAPNNPFPRLHIIRTDIKAERPDRQNVHSVAATERATERATGASLGPIPDLPPPRVTKTRDTADEHSPFLQHVPREQHNTTQSIIHHAQFCRLLSCFASHRAGPVQV